MRLKRRLEGGERGGDVFAVQRALNRWAAPKPALAVTRHYDDPTRARVRRFELAKDLPHPDGVFGQATLDELEPYFDAYGRMRYRLFVPPALPVLGPVFAGGKSVLAHDLTHATTGIPLFPAFDDAFDEGVPIVAPEPFVVIPNPRTGAPWSSANPGKAFYSRGASKIRYWFGHLDRNHAVGTRFERGAFLGRVAPNAIGGGPHVHVALNVELLMGAGRELTHHVDYTHGAPTVGAQLRAWANA